MTDHSASEPDAAGAGAIELQLTLAMAARLARAGKYQQAQAMLDTLTPQQSASAPVLDLSARIHAQRGDLLGAAALWRAAVQQDAGNSTYRAALERIESIQGGRSARGLTTTAALLLLAILLVIGGGWWLHANFEALRGADRANREQVAGQMQTLVATAEQMQRDQVELSETVGEVRRGVEGALQATNERDDALGAQLASQSAAIDALRTETARLASAADRAPRAPAARGIQNLGARIERLAAQMNSGSREDADPLSGSGSRTVAVAELATELWRLDPRASAPEGGPEEQDGNAMSAVWEAIGDMRVEVRDYTGAPLPSDRAGDVEVLAFEPTAGASSQTVKETLRPAVYLDGERIQTGQVIVAVPPGATGE